MILFVTWPIENDAAFRAAYFELIGEMIDAPRTNGTHYLVGTSRAIPAQIDMLGGEWSEEEPESFA